jgi:Starter unit:ACP transacylase in aflatoxin biosynthesis
MVEQLQIYLFGDQTPDTNTKLRALLISKDDPILTSFLEQAYNIIRSKAGQLPLQECDLLSRFASLADILERQKEESLSPAF